MSSANRNARETPRPGPTPPKRIFYAAGCGDAIGAHESWKDGVRHPTEMSLTFSGQIEQYCADIGAELYIVTHHNRRDNLKEGRVRIEHLPKPWPDARGAVFHLGEFIHAARLLLRAIRFKADAAIIESGTPFDAWKGLFALFGMKVVPLCHNALWPDGFKPENPRARLRRFIDGFFWRHAPTATLCVSPACVRQVEEISQRKAGPALLALAQFPAESFKSILPPPPHSARPFNILFVGRVIREKGVFDLLKTAALVEAKAAGQVRWIVCGDGPDLPELRRRCDSEGLAGAVEIRGWATPAELAAALGEAHACIVPTRSEFPEGLAMTAAEAALAGRPVIASKVVPALELLKDAAAEYETDDPQSCADAILGLLKDAPKYDKLRSNARQAAAPFLDRRLGLTEVLKRALGGAPRTLERAPPESARNAATAPRRTVEPHLREARETPSQALFASGKD